LVTVLVTVGRPDDPEDVAAAVLILASPAGGYLTGKILEVDGGIDRPNLDLGIPDF
jgi:7-alpha-hydroxysteroid dehydrogenase